MRVTLFATVMFSLVASSVAAPAPAREWVEFASATTPTPFALKRAEAQGIELKQEPAAPLRGLLVRPEGKGPFPTVILLHGCDGIQPFQEQWTDDLAALGYIALLVDSHGPSGIGDDCPNWPPTANSRAFDAYGALRYLRGLPDVDAARIGVLGWDTGGRAAMAVLEVNGVQQLVPERFAAGVALYPIGVARPPVSAPALILIGDKDDCSPAARFERAAREGGPSPIPLQVELVTDATHGFDNPRFVEPVHFTYAQAQQCLVTDTTMTMAYSKAAREVAVERVRTFFEEHLK